MVTPKDWLKAAAARLFTPAGEPVQSAELKAPQTAERVHLQREIQRHPSRGLTPRKLANILDLAEQGDIVAQYELYEDMEEKDPHIMSEMSKRRRAVTGLDWSIVPPKDPSRSERNAAAELQERIEGLEDIEELLFDVTDAIGKAFAALEIEWRRARGVWMPKSIQHRPQTWFTVQRGFTQQVRLRGPAHGEPLQPFGWILHTHKAKSGWLERSALFRVLVWPYLFKNYSVGDLAEFLEIYGIPLRTGRYPSGATQAAKLTLMKALASLGHNAAGILPQGMEVEFHQMAQGDAKAFTVMLDWCERSQSKAILGGTLTSQADGASSTNALGNVHNEVRKELIVSDAKQMSKTLTRDLVWPIAALNGLATDPDRCPRFVLDTNEPEDMREFAESAPVLVNMGFKIPRQWAQERLGIPEPETESEEDVLQPTGQGGSAGAPPAGGFAGLSRTGTAALNIEHEQRAPTGFANQLDDRLQPHTDRWIEAIRDLVERAESLEQIRDELQTLIPGMSLEQYADVIAEALRVAELTGRDDVITESTEEPGRAS